MKVKKFLKLKKNKVFSEKMEINNLIENFLTVKSKHMIGGGGICNLRRIFFHLLNELLKFLNGFIIVYIQN